MYFILPLFVLLFKNLIPYITKTIPTAFLICTQKSKNGNIIKHRSTKTGFFA
jgi:hypothetical protein